MFLDPRGLVVIDREWTRAKQKHVFIFWFIQYSINKINKIELRRRELDRWTIETFEVFNNSCLIRQILQSNIYKKFRDARDWTQMACLVVSHSDHYTRMFSVLVWECNWILNFQRVVLSNSSNSCKLDENPFILKKILIDSYDTVYNKSNKI